MKFYKKIKAHLELEMPSIDMEIETPIQDESEDVVEIEKGKDETIIGLLQLALVGEYQQWDLYTAYASRLKGLARTPVADEFTAHADEEQSHIELIQRYLVSLGQIPTLQRKKLPEMPEGASIRDIVQLQLKFEQDAVNLYKKILAVVPDNDPLRIDIENVMSKEQEHVHDLELLLKQDVVPVDAKTNAKKAVSDLINSYYEDRKKNEVKSSFLDTVGQQFRPMEPGEPTRPSAGYACDCGCQCRNCQCSYLTKVDHTWCTQALKELRPDIYARWYQRKLLTAQEKAIIAEAISLKWNVRDKRAMMRFLDSIKIR